MFQFEICALMRLFLTFDILNDRMRDLHSILLTIIHIIWQLSYQRRYGQQVKYRINKNSC